MNTLSDYGLVGLSIVALFILGYIATLVLNGRNLKSEREALLWRIGLCAIVAMVVHEVVDFNLHIPACALVFFSLTGMSVSQTYRQRNSRNYWLSTSPLLIVGSVFMFIVISPLIFITWKGQRIASFTKTELQQLNHEQLVKYANQLYEIDSGTAENQEQFADELRVLAARDYEQLKSTGSRHLSKHRQVNQVAQDAIKIYDRVHEANPLKDTLLIKKAMTYDAIGQYGTASLFYAQALRLRPHSTNFHFAAGHHLIAQGLYKQALESFKKASRHVAVSDPKLHQQAAQARIMHKKVSEHIKNNPTH